MASNFELVKSKLRKKVSLVGLTDSHRGTIIGLLEQGMAERAVALVGDLQGANLC